MSLGELHLVSVEERFSWLEKQKEHKIVSTASNGLNIFVEYTETIRECQFSKISEEGDNELNKHQSDLEMLKKRFNFTPLKARDVFLGRRTENFSSFWHKNSGNQNFHYVDVCSPYRYVNSNCVYPVGHPDEIFVAPIFDETQDSQLSPDEWKLSPECDRDDSVCSLPHTAVESNVLNEHCFGTIKCLVLPPRHFASQGCFETVFPTL